MADDERNDQQVDSWMGVGNSIADAIEELNKAEGQKLAQVTNEYMDKESESVNSDTLRDYIKDCSEASSIFAKYHDKLFTLCCSRMSCSDSDKLAYMAGVLCETCGFPDDVEKKIYDKLSVLDETGKLDAIHDEFNDAYDIGIDYLRGFERIKRDKEVLDKYGLYDQVVTNYNNRFDDKRVAEIMSADNWETAFDKYVSGAGVDFGKQDEVAKPPLSEEKFNENIDKIIEFTEKSRTHGYGGFDPDYAAARYLIEDMAERAGRDDVKPTEVIDTIKSLTDSGGAESQKRYLRERLGPQAEKAENKEANNPALDAFTESARRMGDAVNGITNPKRDEPSLRDAFGDAVVDEAQATESKSLESDGFSI